MRLHCGGGDNQGTAKCRVRACTLSYMCGVRDQVSEARPHVHGLGAGLRIAHRSSCKARRWAWFLHFLVTLVQSSASKAGSDSIDSHVLATCKGTQAARTQNTRSATAQLGIKHGCTTSPRFEWPRWLEPWDQLCGKDEGSRSCKGWRSLVPLRMPVSGRLCVFCGAVHETPERGVMLQTGRVRQLKN